MNNISKNISYREATHSITALRNGIKNDPSKQNLENMIVIAEKVFEPLRKGLGDKPIRISSFFRSRQLNTAIGGSVSSSHLAERDDAAIDIDNDGNPDGPTNRQIFFYIKNYLDFDQLIWEYGDDGSPAWVHVGFSRNKNRRQVLRCINGKYKLYK